MGTDAKSGETGREQGREASAELRTIGFRLREIQRLLSMRVMQENRRLEAEGLEPVADATFFKGTGTAVRLSSERVTHQVEWLGALELGDSVELTLLDGTTVSGTAGPIEYVPTERLRLELRPRDDSSIRYEVRTVVAKTGWSPVTVRRYELGTDDWDVLGVVRSVEAE